MYKIQFMLPQRTPTKFFVQKVKACSGIEDVLGQIRENCKHRNSRELKGHSPS